MVQSVRGRMLATSMMGGLAIAAAMSVQPAFAQDEVAIEEIIVTGSRIRRVETDTPAPVLVIDQQAMTDRGFVQPGQMLNQLTSVSPSFASPDGSGDAAGTGQQYPNLFGLGPGRTLTLVNGRRFVTSSAGQSNTALPGLGDRVVDTNIIPTGLIQRVDVVQAGGAAVYGSDAIAGVINYVLKDSFEGLELDAQYGISSRDDYPQTSLRATAGRNFLDDRANVAVNLEYSKTEPLYDKDRPRSNLARITVNNPADTGPNDGISSLKEIFDARFWEFNPNGVLFSPAPAPVPNFLYRVNGTPQQFDANGNLVAYNPGTISGVPFASGGEGFSYRDLAALYTGVERITGNVIGHYDITDRIKLSGELLYAKVEGRDPYAVQISNTILNSAASGAGAIAISRANPYLSDQARALLGPGGPPLYLSKWWNDLLHTREGVNTTETVRALVSLDGDFDFADRNFYWSASYSHGETDGRFESWGVNNAKFANAINAVRNSAGNIVCAINADASAANDDPNCAPINPFGANNVSQVARLYVNERVGQHYLNFQDDFLATIGGDLVKLPAGMVKFSAAYEYRYEKAKFAPFMANQLGLTGTGVPTEATAASYNTNELSAEVLVPILGGDFTLPLVQSLDLNGAYRRVDNSLAGKENVWSAGLQWGVFDGLTLRASRSRNFRAPTLDQMFAPSRTELGSISRDPCDADRINSGPNPAVRMANCRALFAANPSYGPLAGFQDPSENFSNAQITTGGNLDLRNEISDTTTYGFVFQPSFAPGLTIVVDRVEVDLTDGLSAFLPVNFLETCFDSTEMPADVCSRFTRNELGHVVTAQSTTYNAGQVTYRGEVYNINYRFSPGRFFNDADYGELELAVEATHTAKLETSVTGFDTTRTDGTTAQPDWVGRFDARWSRGPIRATYSLFYLPETKVNRFDTIENTPTPDIKANIRHSISAQYAFDKYTVRAGVINLTDEEPSYPTRTYGDILGRQYYVGLNARF
ncbi:TonB-dependent receptor domain-containing protein [Phenylobacterium sp. 58.2.17]|uniref:TonB-dependent receptor domain-containing protein n=1 Tax=Phenylobacterium sp. 58.2.17 TaxID=2969306 RepID=UPI0022653B80|nr:TonB-dependent receptor [Phenylobacterium sp. 58.2.17]MCX7588119.1 TonB-dependent receptor [Phenylobacterium sp. 58.2.17]